MIPGCLGFMRDLVLLVPALFSARGAVSSPLNCQFERVLTNVWVLHSSRSGRNLSVRLPQRVDWTLNGSMVKCYHYNNHDLLKTHLAGQVRHPSGKKPNCLIGSTITIGTNTMTG